MTYLRVRIELLIALYSGPPEVLHLSSGEHESLLGTVAAGGHVCPNSSVKREGRWIVFRLRK